jgi:hypothetical protein
LSATIIPVPGEYSKIQNAVNASVNGDTIAVSPGTYFENINFKGKNIMLTSLYYLNNDNSYITSTIINGSVPANPDTASCVIFCSGETNNAVLQGFTITGGTGTKWTDIHGAGVFREGGGVLSDISSPTIKHNIITGNKAVNTTGVTGAGGGGLRIGDGNPQIIDNVIVYNQGNYGPGIVLNYTGCVIRNNIIASNTGGSSYYGGSAIWIWNNNGTIPKIIENNTIVYNTSSLTSGTGGILCWSASDVIIRNNIIRNNFPSANQIKKISCSPTVEYSDIQGGFTGGTNISDIDPIFMTDNYLLSDESPCIDCGNIDTGYDDIENLNFPGNALFPSKGLIRNDIGAYGGPSAVTFPNFQTQTSIEFGSGKNFRISLCPNPVCEKIILNMSNVDFSKIILITIYNIQGIIVFQKAVNEINTEINCNCFANGIYTIKINFGGKSEILKIIKQ